MTEVLGYNFVDANTVIYLSKISMLTGRSTLDSLYIPNEPVVITTTVLTEATWNSAYPDGALIKSWYKLGAASGRIITIGTSGNPVFDEFGKRVTGQGERSIDAAIAGEFSGESVRIVSLNFKDFARLDRGDLVSTPQTFLFESLISGGISLEQFSLYSKNLMIVSGEIPIITLERMEDSILVISNGVTIEYVDGGLVVTDISGIAHFIRSDKKFGISSEGNVAEFDGRCFPAHTRILTPRATSVAISTLRPGDIILSYDVYANKGCGALVPRRVVRIYRNATTEWVRLTWVEGGERRELVATPGHHFLDQFGLFPTIHEMTRTGRATVVLASGALAEVTAERIVYSAETAHLFERAVAHAAARRALWSRFDGSNDGKLTLAPAGRRGRGAGLTRRRGSRNIAVSRQGRGKTWLPASSRTACCISAIATSRARPITRPT